MQFIRKNGKQVFLLRVIGSQWSAHFFDSNSFKRSFTGGGSYMEVKKESYCSVNSVKWKEKVLQKSFRVFFLFRFKWRLFSWAVGLLRNYLIAKLLMMCCGTGVLRDIKIKAFSFPSTLTWGYMRGGKRRGESGCILYPFV